MFLPEWREFPSAPCMCSVYYRGADKSLARPGRKQANVSAGMIWISFRRLAFAEKKRNLMTARVSMLLKPRAFLTFFRACLLPGRAKDLSAPRYTKWEWSAQHFRVAELLVAVDITPVYSPRCRGSYQSPQNKRPINAEIITQSGDIKYRKVCNEWSDL